ncbi:MAG: helix-turn-helix domain-containing protein [Candidatus Omnitrophica bacterium]|nr:helix-turn-helix domain-containing protein [Candidatus Omnitrophota bacterium]
MSELLTVKELAEYLRWNARTVYRKAQEGKIPAIKVGAGWRFKKGDIDQWLETGRVEGNG